MRVSLTEQYTFRICIHRLLWPWLCSNWGLSKLNFVAPRGTSDVPCAAEKGDGIALEAKETRKRHEGSCG